MQADGRGWLFAPTGARRRPAARRTTSRTSRRSRTRSTGSGANPARAAVRRARTTRYNPAAGDRRLPVRRHDLPADRAPHRRRMSRTLPLPGRAAAGDVLRGEPGAGRGARARARRLGDDRHRRARRSRRACWSPTGSRRSRSAGRAVHQVGLPYHWGTRGLVDRRLGQRPVPARARPERAHPGGEGGDLRHPAGPPAARAGAAGRRGRATAARAASRASGFFTDTTRLHRLQGVRGRVQGVERRARRPARLHAASPTTTPARSARTAGATSRSSSSAERRRACDGGDVTCAWLMSSDVCKHCTEAACLDVCPTGAIFRTEFGTVVVQEDVCNGCGYCVVGLPVRRARPARGRRARVEVHALLRPAEGRPGAGLRQGVPDRLDPVRRRSTSCASAPQVRVRELQRARRARTRGSTARTPTTAWAARARSSCCSTSPRSTGCRPTRWCRPGDLGAVWTAAGLAAGALAAGVAASFAGEPAVSAGARGRRWCRAPSRAPTTAGR